MRKITTGDPTFNADEPVVINGYPYVPAEHLIEAMEEFQKIRNAAGLGAESALIMLLCIQGETRVAEVLKDVS